MLAGQPIAAQALAVPDARGASEQAGPLAASASRLNAAPGAPRRDAPMIARRP